MTRSRITGEAPYISEEAAAEMLDLSLAVFRRQVLGVEVPLRQVGVDQVVDRADVAAYIARLAGRSEPEPLPAPGEEDIEEFVGYDPPDPGRPLVRDPLADYNPAAEAGAAARRLYAMQDRALEQQHRRDKADGARQAATEASRRAGHVVEIGPGLVEWHGGLPEDAEEWARQVLADPAVRAAIVRQLAEHVGEPPLDPPSPPAPALRAAVERVLAAPETRSMTGAALALKLAVEAHLPLATTLHAVTLACGAGSNGAPGPEDNAEELGEIEDWVPDAEPRATPVRRAGISEKFLAAGRQHAL